MSEGHHDHLIDLKTGEIIEFVDDEIEKLKEEKKALDNELANDPVPTKDEIKNKKLFHTLNYTKKLQFFNPKNEA